MTTRQIILYSLIAPSFTVLLFVVPALGTKSLYKEWVITLFAALIVPWLIGTFISGNLSLLSKDLRRKRQLFISGQFVIIAPLLFLFIYKKVGHDERNDSATNLENNLRFMTSGDPHQERTYGMSAYLKLESAFDDPGAFELNSFLEERKDTLVGKDSLPVHYVYFQYALNDGANYYSKLKVFKDSANIEVFNGNVEDLPPNLGKLSESEAKTLDSLVEQHPELQDKDVQKVLQRFKK